MKGRKRSEARRGGKDVARPRPSRKNAVGKKRKIAKRSASSRADPNLKTITQKETFGSPPDEVYAVLMDSAKHSELVGAEAIIGAGVGGRISVWDDYISGENVELVPGKLIVQRLRFAEDGWPEAHWSVLTITLEASRGGGTSMRVTHSGVPASSADDIAQGWKEYYWGPLRTMLDG